MLKKLLEQVSQNRLITPAQLSLTLGVPQELVDLMLEDLEKAGYLRSVAGCTEGKCASCHQSMPCDQVRSRLWTRTDKAIHE